MFQSIRSLTSLKEIGTSNVQMYNYIYRPFRSTSMSLQYVQQQYRGGQRPFPTTVGSNGGGGFGGGRYLNNNSSNPRSDNGGDFTNRVAFRRTEQRSDNNQQQQQQSNFDFIEGRPSGGRSNDFGNSMPPKNVDWTLENLPPINKNTYKATDQANTCTPAERDAFLLDNNVLVKTKGETPLPVFDFDAMNFPAPIINLLKNNYEKPTPIQSIGWPVAMTGGDMIGVSQTGSGKTLSFFLPAIQHILSQPRETGPYTGPRVLIIAPTRELSVQISNEAQPYLSAARLNSVVMFGGAAKTNQIRDMRRNPQVVIGTPGRIIDMMNDGYLNMKRVSFFVLDEADRMLEMGFEDQIRSIFTNIRPDRQVMYWTATWPRKVQTLAHEFIVDPVHVQVGSTELAANPNIKQMFTIVESERDKVTALVDTLEKIFTERPESKVIIFTMTKGGADKLSDHIRQIGNARIESIHGDKVQSRRIAIIDGFKKNYIDILVATDVASRGLDIRTITDVINFSLPSNIESYVHRIGRTARAGATGHSHTLISKSSANDIELLPEVIQILERSQQEVPDDIRALAPRRQQHSQQRYGGGQQRGGFRGGNRGYNNRPSGGYGGNRGGYGGGGGQSRSGPVSFNRSASN
ncbi:hypothetical protein SAMD00019534_117790 [Acytostelium subglobosum LB1]|uniref:hypothetical protein n=1 Tax=Acytostelium subglobosum LB1 TaxID=1410327 RepID=UPI0006449227|nr:hypothetical protein SAMD00019534_117790 [Acytostelium subglobosum LB1]GAM28603.1 hypothetical protein SAMD00019534_117790 [Acytostelium subglobosum LB1]|eukprot:XP_012748381.1 hypothetical protein SAMD00019534_117790 [Acytostelium subglobosum LB1]